MEIDHEIMERARLNWYATGSKKLFFIYLREETGWDPFIRGYVNIPDKAKHLLLLLASPHFKTLMKAREVCRS